MDLENANLHLYLELNEILHLLPLQTQAAAGMELHRNKGSRQTSTLHHFPELGIPSLNICQDASEGMPQATSRVNVETYMTYTYQNMRSSLMMEDQSSVVIKKPHRSTHLRQAQQ